MNNNSSSEIYCLLVQLVSERLIIPRSCVAAVISYQTPVELAGTPDWHLGVIAWNGRQVPVVSFEACCGEAVAPVSSRSRLVILYAAAHGIESGHLALLAQEFPPLLRASPELLRTDNTQPIDEQGLLICQLRLLDEAPWVPDLPRLEALVASATRASPVD
jgi:chemosensory pili system protein ChpC